jgi:hypothetical protein
MGTMTDVQATRLTGESGQRVDQTLRGFLDAGRELAGKASGPGRELLTGESHRPFPGTAGDWAALRMFLRVAEDFARRSLSPWERARTAAVLLTAAHRLDEQLTAGLAVRRDDFFLPVAGFRAAAEEFAEAVLSAARHEYQEAKLPYLGNLLAGVTFRDSLDQAQIIMLVRLAAALSFRQLCLLAVFSHTERFALRATDYHEAARVPFAAVAALQDTFELTKLSLVFQSTGDPLTIRDLTPADLTVGGTGALLVKLMNLSRIAADEIDDLAALLR